MIIIRHPHKVINAHHTYIDSCAMPSSFAQKCPLGKQFYCTVFLIGGISFLGLLTLFAVYGDFEDFAEEAQGNVGNAIFIFGGSV